MTDQESQTPAPFFSKVTDAAYSAQDKSSIDCNVTLSSNGKTVAFTAIAGDCEAHGIELWNDLQAGKYGKIKPYRAPVSKEA